MKNHLCKICGEKNSENFYSRQKSTCKKCMNEQNKQYRENNEEAISQRKKIHYHNNSERIIKKNNQYQKERLKVDPGYKFMYSLRKRHIKVLKGLTSTTDGLGCTSTELVSYIKSKFQEGMSLVNHGEWHLDHILPISSGDFDLDGNWCLDSEYNKSLIHYTNLQPLWAEDNLKKSNKIQ